MNPKTFSGISRGCYLNIITLRQDLEWNKKMKKLSAIDVAFIRMSFKSRQLKG